MTPALWLSLGGLFLSLDVDRFLRFLACTVVLANMDSFIGLSHNWLMYLDPKTDRFVFIHIPNCCTTIEAAQANQA